MQSLPLSPLLKPHPLAPIEAEILLFWGSKQKIGADSGKQLLKNPISKFQIPNIKASLRSASFAVLIIYYYVYKKTNPTGFQNLSDIKREQLLYTAGKKPYLYIIE